MYTDVLRSIAGIQVFPIVSLLLFVTFFSGMLIWASRLRADRLAECARMPLDPAITSGGRPVHAPTSHGETRDTQAR